MVRTPALPADIRLMNATAFAVALLAGGLLLASGAAWIARRPMFALQAIRLSGDVTRNNAVTVRANAATRLAGNFFTMNLHAARDAFEAVPWVRRAVVRKVWPNRLEVTLEEHKPVALWRGDAGNDRLVNSYGEIFEANLGDVEEDQLPEFEGPEDAAPQILSMYRRLVAALEPLGGGLARLALSGRGSWQVAMDDGVEIELGRGTEDDVVARVGRFVRTLPKVTGGHTQALAHADLRNADGYAVRLNGAAVAPAERH